MGQPVSYTPNEVSVEIGKPQELLQWLTITRAWPILNSGHLGEVHLDLVARDNVAEERDMHHQVLMWPDEVLNAVFHSSPSLR